MRAVVGQRQRRHSLVGDPLRHLADAAQPVEQAELRVDVEVDEVAVSARVRGSQGHPAIVAMRCPGIRADRPSASEWSPSPSARPYAGRVLATATPTARAFVHRLASLRPGDHQGVGPYAGIGMGQIFKLAREFQAMPPAEIERLLESDDHPVRVGAVSIMDWQARDRKTPVERRRELFDLYIRRHDRIDTWDLVDRSAIHVVGEYLVDRPQGHPERAGAVSEADGAANRDPEHLRIHPTGSARRHLSDRRSARQRPGRPRRQGRWLDAARSREARPALGSPRSSTPMPRRCRG